MSNWPIGDGETAGRIRAYDWAATPLGPISHWPQSLKTVVDLVLSSTSMMSLVWGAAAVHLYNDGFAELLREHRTPSLGRSAYDTFARSRDVFADDLAHGMAGHSARLLERRYPVLRNGRLEEAWFDVDYAPVRNETGVVDGVLWTLKEVTGRKLAEAALRESAARNRLLIQSWTQAMWETDANGAVTVDSPSWRAYTGQTLEEWLGYGWLDAIHPDDQAYAERQWRKAVAGRGLVDAEFRLRAPGGGWRWTNVRAAPVLDTAGHVEKWAGMNIDIDARKRTEAALRESERRYRALFQSMDQAYAVVEVMKDQGGAWTDFLFLEVNPAFMVHTSMPCPVGKTATELLGTPNPQWAALYGQALDTGEPLRVEETEATLGRTFDLNIFALDRQRNRVAILFTNITERKRSAQVLSQSEEHLRALVEGVSQLVWRAVDVGDWIWASPQWTAFTGQAEADSHGRGWLDPLHPDDRPVALAAWAGNAGGGFDVEYRIRGAVTGEYRWFQTRAAPRRDARGEVIEWLGTSTDIHQLKALQESQAVMVAELQHRTRNLIAVVQGIADDTMDETGPTEAFRPAFSHRLSALSRVQGLLSRSEAEPITIASLLRLELDALGAGAAGDRIAVSGPEVFLRPSTVQTLALALHELATNARKYGALSHDRGRLSVSWSEHSAAGGPRLVLDWIETGLEHAPGRTQPASRGGGYGRELIEQALPHALGATTSYVLADTGVRCTIDLPARPVARNGTTP